MAGGVRLALPDVPTEPLCSPEPLTAKLGEVFMDGLPLSVPLAAPPLPPTPVGVLVGGVVGVEPPPPPPLLLSPWVSLMQRGVGRQRGRMTQSGREERRGFGRRTLCERRKKSLPCA